MTRRQQELLLEKRIKDVEDLVVDLHKDFARTNKHRHKHMLGKTDHHLRYQSIAAHIQGLEGILKRVINDIQEANQYINELWGQLSILYAYDDEDEYLRQEAELSFKEALRDYEQSCRRANA